MSTTQKDLEDNISAVERFERMKMFHTCICGTRICPDDNLCPDCERVAAGEAAVTAYWKDFEPDQQYAHLKWADSPLVSLKEREEWDDEYHCSISPEGPGTHCYNARTRTVYEPYTPGQFALECCEEHAESLISQGYLRGRKG